VGPLRDRLVSRIAGLQLQNHVRMLGPKPNEELADWYRAATLFVLPSRSEGLPTVLREAAACGTPFVASRVGGIPEIAHLAPSRLVRPDDAGELAAAIGEMLANPVGHAESVQTSSSLPSHDESAAQLSEILEAHLLHYRMRATHFGSSLSLREFASRSARS
jgi:glycosyltransferase involved in cell wall biosynthesis